MDEKTDKKIIETGKWIRPFTEKDLKNDNIDLDLLKIVVDVLLDS